MTAAPGQYATSTGRAVQVTERAEPPSRRASTAAPARPRVTSSACTSITSGSPPRRSTPYSPSCASHCWSTQVRPCAQIVSVSCEGSPCWATTRPESSAIHPSAAQAVRRWVIRVAATAATTTTTVPSSSSTRLTRASVVCLAFALPGAGPIVSSCAFNCTSCKHWLRTPEPELPGPVEREDGQDREEDRDLPD